MWHIRQQLYEILVQPTTLKFRHKVYRVACQSTEDADKNLLSCITAARKRGIQVTVADSGIKVAKYIRTCVSEHCALRASSRMINCIEAYHTKEMPMMIQTDMFDLFSRQCRKQGLFHYPRLQVKPEDYWQVAPWSNYLNSANKRLSALKILKKYTLNNACKTQSSLCGANAITADGMILLAENMGNIRFLLGQEKVVIVASAERIVKDLDAAWTYLKIRPVHGFESGLPASTHILSAPSYTDTISDENGTFGTSSLHLVIVRKGLSPSHTPRCTGCGLCAIVCPAYEIHGVAYGWHGYSAAAGILKAWQWGGIQAAKQAGVSLCQQCGNCSKICPARRDPANQIKYIHCKLSDDSGWLLEKKDGARLARVYNKTVRQMYCIDNA